jgi:hypothetical protein
VWIEILLAVDRLAAIDPREEFAQRGIFPRIFRLVALGLFVQTPTPDKRCSALLKNGSDRSDPLLSKAKLFKQPFACLSQ